MLSYCEVCRTVYHNPSLPYKHLGLLDEIRQIRTLIGRQFFAHCQFCQRIQIFQPVDDKGEDQPKGG